VAEDVYETCMELKTLLSGEIVFFNSLNNELNSKVKIYNRTTKKLNQINNIKDERNEVAIAFDVSSE
jgi:hypothetical protein